MTITLARGTVEPGALIPCQCNHTHPTECTKLTDVTATPMVVVYAAAALRCSHCEDLGHTGDKWDTKRPETEKRRRGYVRTPEELAAEAAADAEALAEQEEEWRMLRAPQRANALGSLKDWRLSDFEHLGPQAPGRVAAMRAWAQVGARRGHPHTGEPLPHTAVLYGPPGSGKTCLAAAAATEAVDANWRRSVALIPWGELAKSWTPDGDPALFTRATTVGVLIIDDLGRSNVTSNGAGKAAEIIDMRRDAGYLTVITTNLMPPPGGDPFAPDTSPVGLEPLWSRLNGSMCVEWRGKDLRRMGAARF